MKNLPHAMTNEVTGVMQLQAVSSLCPVPFLSFGCSFLGLKLHILWDKDAVWEASIGIYICVCRTFERNIEQVVSQCFFFLPLLTNYILRCYVLSIRRAGCFLNERFAFSNS